MPLAWAVPFVALALVACGDDGGGPSDALGDWTVAFDASDVGWLMNVGGAGDDLYAVGGADARAGDYGVIWRFDGQDWAEVFRADWEADGVSLLNWVHRISDDDVVVVGSKGVILRWDGEAWTRDASPTDLDLWGVWGPAGAGDDLWAVGGGSSPDGGAPIRVVLRYDGAAWREVDAPLADDGTWFKVWGSGPDDVVLVGSNLSLARWDGESFAEADLPPPPNPAAINDLISVWGTGPDRFAVTGGRNAGLALTWDGTDWRYVDLPLGTPGMNGVFMDRPDRFHLAGIAETALVVDFDTGEVTDDYRGEIGGARPLDYHAIYGDDRGRIWAVGANFVTPPAGIATVRGGAGNR